MFSAELGVSESVASSSSTSDCSSSSKTIYGVVIKIEARAIIVVTRIVKINSKKSTFTAKTFEFYNEMN